MKWNLVFSFWTLTLLSQVAWAGQYTIKLRHFGTGISESECKHRISRAAEAFAGQANAGTTLLGAGCVKSSSYQGGIDGEIVYVASQYLEITTTDDRQAFNSWAFYPTAEACREGLNNELGVFRRLTGLEPFVHYCYPHSAMGSDAFRARIDAVGVSEIRKFSSFDIWSGAVPDPTPLREALLQQAYDHDLTVVEVLLENSIHESRFSYGYYGRSPMFIQSAGQLSFPNLRDCQEAAADITSAWQTDTKTNPYFDCTSGRLAYRLTYWWLTQSLVGDSHIRESLLPMSYPTLEDCRKDVDRVRRVFADSGNEVSGLSCGYVSQQVRMLSLIDKSSQL